MARQSITDIIQDAEHRKFAVFANPNKYGYQFNINNTVLQVLYNAYSRHINMKQPIGDNQRIAWERSLWAYLQKIFRTYHKTQLPDYDNQPLSEYVVGWQLTQLEDMINYRLAPDKAIEQLYGVDINDTGSKE